MQSQSLKHFKNNKGEYFTTTIKIPDIVNTKCTNSAIKTVATYEIGFSDSNPVTPTIEATNATHLLSKHHYPTVIFKHTIKIDHLLF